MASTRTAIVVEPNEDLADLFRQALADYGFSVVNVAPCDCLAQLAANDKPSSSAWSERRHDQNGTSILGSRDSHGSAGATSVLQAPDLSELKPDLLLIDAARLDNNLDPVADGLECLYHLQTVGNLGDVPVVAFALDGLKPPIRVGGDVLPVRIDHWLADGLNLFDLLDWLDNFQQVSAL